MKISSLGELPAEGLVAQKQTRRRFVILSVSEGSQDAQMLDFTASHFEILRRKSAPQDDKWCFSVWATRPEAGSYICVAAYGSESPIAAARLDARTDLARAMALALVVWLVQATEEDF